ncbi:hypothetical protein [Aquimarina brevivitae]|uniref:DUF4149 domain-containing protein n=1 Tax=Aquimarina brevivitae TaxID=323412 RepID=A0A4V2F4U8_9FLAO|nr:hypothetical protein [Aquimarina brevivitae]RZS90569.1 hypothetical protein EV197_3363 [Aquimarina brevivitae]
MSNDKLLGWIGIGVFLCLTLQGISFLVSLILEESLLYSEMKPLYSYGLSQYVSLIVVLFIFIVIIKRLKTIDVNKPKITQRLFMASVFAYIITQVLGFAQPFVTSLYQTTQYLELKNTYYDSLQDQYALKNFAIETPVWLLKYVIIAILILREFKTYREHCSY